MSIVGKEKKGSMCGKATKGILTEGASMPCKGKGAGKRKKVEESREKRGSAHGQAIRNAAKVEKEFGGRVEKEGRGALW